MLFLRPLSRMKYKRRNYQDLGLVPDRVSAMFASRVKLGISSKMSLSRGPGEFIDTMQDHR
jgi:hypothetical protein